MRRGNDNGFIMSEDETTLIGINLGADFCSEHEWGIKKTQRDFKIKSELKRRNTGIKRTAIHNVPDTLRFYLGGNGTALLIYSDNFRWRSDEQLEMDYVVENYLRERRQGEELYTGWSDGDFAVYATTPEGVEALQEIWAAFQKKDIAIWLGGGGPFKNSGLNIVIKSRIPKDGATQMDESDQDTLNLNEYVKRIGILVRLKEKQETKSDSWPKPCGYYACAPRWIDSEEQKNAGTEYKVIFWLNPTNQSHVNFGWFTVEQLDQWIEGKGPIPKGDE